MPSVPDIAALHPQVVHFVVASLFVGVGLRLFSLTGLLKFTDPAATVLILIGAVAAVLAVESGVDAHGPVERIPGARNAVVEHEEWGERTRNLFLVVAAIELVALGAGAMKSRQGLAKGLRFASAIVGVGGLVVLYEAAEHGGDLVYEYAGGVGIRSGEPEDVTRLLLAGLYNQAVLDREQGRPEDAARLMAEMTRRYPDDLTVQLMGAESMLQDAHDPQAALAAANRLSIPEDNQQLEVRKGLLMVDAYNALGDNTSANALLQQLQTKYPQNRLLQQRTQPTAPATPPTGN
jgi:uncharacterized membrane protein